MSKKNIPIDEIISIGGSIISDSEPKTTAGKILRWIKRIISIKDSANIRIKK